MSKKVKDLITKEYEDAYGEVDSACVVSVIGMDAISANRFRGELRSKNIRLQVVKNSLARRALMDSPLKPLTDALEGPCAVATGGESVIDLAKILVGMKKTYPAIELKRGIIEGDPDLVDVEQLARMKGRSELLSDLAGLITSPARNLAGCLAGPGGRLAGCFKAMGEKEEA